MGNELQNLKIGDRVGYEPLLPKECPLPHGDACWHILLTQPASEATAIAGLVGRGFRAYGPQIYRRVPIGRADANGKRKIVERVSAMFPGYIFVDLREGQHDFRRAVATAGVQNFLYIGGERKIMPLDLMDTIRGTEAEEFCHYQGKVGPRGKRVTNFNVGQEIKIKRGPFKDFFAKIENLDDRGRVEVLLSIFGRETPAWLEGHQIEAA